MKTCTFEKVQQRPSKVYQWLGRRCRTKTDSYISPTPPIILQGGAKKCEIWHRFRLYTVDFEAAWLRNRTTYRNTDLILETSMNVLYPPQIFMGLQYILPEFVIVCSQLWELVRTKLPLPQTSRENGLNLPARAVAPHQKSLRDCDVRRTWNLHSDIWPTPS